MDNIRKGWDSEIVFSRLPKESERYAIHDILKEKGVYLEDSEILETSFFPLVDRVGNISSKVEIREDGEILDSSWENKEQYIIDAEFGTVQFPYGSRLDGKEITIDYNFRQVIGYSTGISLSVSTSLDSAPAIGSRNPVGVTVGTTEITGSVDEYYVDRLLYEQASSLSEGRLISFDAEIISSPNIRKPLIIKLTDVKFSTWNLDFTQDGITAQSCDFSAQNINIIERKK